MNNGSMITAQPEISFYSEISVLDLSIRKDINVESTLSLNDSGKFINLNIKTNNIKELWVKIKKYLQEHNELANSTIVTCEGSQGWDNYLLLHHFDSKEKLNEI